MDADSRTREDLLAEIGALQRRVAGLEAERERCMAMERVLRQGEDRYRRLLESVTDYVYTVVVKDGRAVATDHGPNCVAVTGYTAGEYRDNPLLWLTMVPEEDRPAVLDHAARLLAGEDAGPLEHRIVHKDGTIRHVRNTPVLHRNTAGRLLAYDGIVNDITERKRAEELFTRLSLHDGLTGLPGRALYMDRLRQTMVLAERHNERAAVYFIDLDHFKDVNDQHGHETGDAVLSQTAQRLIRCVRRSDTVARLGGDEFVALTPGIGETANAVAIAEKMVAAMREPFEVRGVVCRLGASVGVAFFPDDARRGGELLRLADAAMYAAKNAGRNGWRLAGSLGED
ncbi:diguanylate cyclase/phosphodiesterase (GGDEF & EAL domains) with PAS/PAC sensor(s) [Desulfovibrio sp. DV]|uniref:sensor domain-containing diguanylate cyclase n=1 Tax=Desulfovibrio sp. DV TaxID=1844708 RepID=UPI00094B857D|nr:sensor domain-containing diguanylate cyclase [Desulfovibrio sp. DV]OLN27351.1 diguanylate cyclase/phosphodiesterase (GGDEF & EAL domains) with PAS/PAC sensor(s) [Desulfovibrio sp. DV]